MTVSRKSRHYLAHAAIVAATCLALGGCQSPMYSGVPDDQFTGSIAPSYAPGTYEPPSKVGRAEEEDHEPMPTARAEPQYEYRGGRDPVTGRAKTQL
jgi:hypothetical protein